MVQVAMRLAGLEMEDRRWWWDRCQRLVASPLAERLVRVLVARLQEGGLRVLVRVLGELE